MDPVAVGFVVFGVAAADHPEAVGDEETAEGGGGVVGEVVRGEDAGGSIAGSSWL